MFAVVALLRGFGAPIAKSALLLFVSVHPPPARSAAVVLAVAAVEPAPSKQFAVVPYPTKSAMNVPVGQVPVNVAAAASATLAPVALKAIVPVASAAGRFTVPPAPADSCTR